MLSPTAAKTHSSHSLHDEILYGWLALLGEQGHPQAGARAPAPQGVRGHGGDEQRQAKSEVLGCSPGTASSKGGVEGSTVPSCPGNRLRRLGLGDACLAGERCRRLLTALRANVQGLQELTARLVHSTLRLARDAGKRGTNPRSQAFRRTAAVGERGTDRENPWSCLRTCFVTSPPAKMGRRERPRQQGRPRAVRE